MASRAASSSSGTRAAPKRTRCTGAGCRKLAPAGRKRCDDHKPGGAGRRGRKLYGCTEARIFTKPLRPLTRSTTKGFEVIEFAEMIGEPLLPWQKWAVIHALELLPDGTFRFRTVLILVARQNGKSHLKRIVTLWRMYMDGARRIVGAAQDLSLARDQWVMCQESIHGCTDLQEEWVDVRNVNGDEKFWAAGCEYAIKATNDKAGRGGSNDEVNIDELRAQKDWKAWGSLSKTTMARDNGQVWAMSNAGDDSSVVLNKLRDSGKSAADPSLCLLEWSAADGCELGDTEAWRQANPGLGYTVSEAAIRSALGTDPPDVFRTEVLCQRVEALNSAIDLAAWKDCTDAAGNGLLGEYRDRIAACVDVSIIAPHPVALYVAAKIPDGRIRIENAGVWESTEAARLALPGLLGEIKATETGWFPSGPAAAIAAVLRSRPGSRELKGTEVAEACQSFADLVIGRQILHNDDPFLNAHIAVAQKLNSGDGWRFVRRGGTGHVHGAYAAAGVVQVAVTMPEPKRSRIRLLG